LSFISSLAIIFSYIKLNATFLLNLKSTVINNIITFVNI